MILNTVSISVRKCCLAETVDILIAKHQDMSEHLLESTIFLTKNWVTIPCRVLKKVKNEQTDNLVQSSSAMPLE